MIFGSASYGDPSRNMTCVSLVILPPLSRPLSRVFCPFAASSSPGMANKNILRDDDRLPRYHLLLPLDDIKLGNSSSCMFESGLENHFSYTWHGMYGCRYDHGACMPVILFHMVDVTVAVSQ